MALVSGARFGSFEVLEQLGAGGMGEVYRARDTRLDRTVALKVIRASQMAGRGRVDRFKREARAISRLTHPHICALYDIGEQEGEAFLVMEHVSGETLAARLERGPLSIAEVVRYGAQIADALDAAHRNGVVHRDLKPSNIMLTRDGVKLLDFGLAKLRDIQSDPIGEISTISLGLSEDGLVLGSLPYMAPEQLEAKPADARTDLFALGVVLYEMVTGEAPFQASSKASLIVAILSHEPSPVSTRRPLTPALLDRSIQRCLAKSPDDRWQNAADFAAELRWIAETPSGFERTSLFQLLRASGSRRWQIVVCAFAAMGGIAAATAFMWPGRLVPTYTPVTFRRGAVSAARFLNDGQNVVYSASWEGQPYDVFLGHEGSPDARSLGLENGRVLSVSPIGDLALVFGRQNISHFAGATTLARVPLAGGTRRDLLEGVTDADWIPETDLLAVVRIRASDGRSIVEFPIGTKVHDASAVWSLRVSPDGRRVAFFEGPVRFGSNPEAAVVMVDRSGRASTLTTGWSGFGLAWNRSGSEIWFTGTKGPRPPALHGVSLRGTERSILEAPDWLVLQDVFHDGRVLVSRNSVRLSISCQSVDMADERDLTWMNGSNVGDLSGDGQTLIFSEELFGSSGLPWTFRRTLDRAPAVRLGLGYGASLSPDGKWVLSLLKEKLALLPMGAGETRMLSPGPVRLFYSGAWLPGGHRIVVTGTETGFPRSRLYVQSVDDDEAPRAITPEGVTLASHAASADGVAVLGRAGADWRLYPIEGGSPQSVPALSAADDPLRWSQDRRSMYVVSRARPWVNARGVFRVDLTTGARTLVKTLSPADPIGVDNIGAVVMAPDGSCFCYTYLRRLGSLFVVDNVR